MTSVSDNFNVANNAVLSGQLTWTEVSSTSDWKTFNNQAANNASGGSPTARCESALSSGDHAAQVVMANPGSTPRGGCAVRFAAAANTCYVFWTRDNATTTYRLAKVVAGVVSTLATVSTTPPAFPATLRLEVHTSGSDAVLVGKVGGVQVITHTDSSSPISASNVRGGLYAEGTTAQEQVLIDSFAAEDLTAPGAPTNLAATPGDTEVVLDWDAPASDGGKAITDYVVQWRTTAGPGSWNTFADGTSTTSAATVTGLTNGTSYDFQVAAVNVIGTGTYSATDTATPSAGGAVEPDPPTALTLGNPGPTTQPLSWTAPAEDGGEDITDYVVEYSLAGADDWDTFADGVSTNTNTTVTGLTALTEYDYRVSAVNSVGTGDPSDTETGFTDAPTTRESGTLQEELNRLAGTSGLAETGAANAWAGTDGLALVGALNAKNGSSGLDLQGVCNELAGTEGLAAPEALARYDG